MLHMMRFDNLDAKTRKLMLDEIELDMRSGTLYPGRLLTERGKQELADCLMEAVKFNDVWLAESLMSRGLVLRFETTASGVKTPITDEDVRDFAGQVFNRYYCRAVCIRAKEHGVSPSVYWADEDTKAPPEVSSWEFEKVEPGPFLNLLRTQPSLEAAFNIPGRRYSGLSLAFSDPLKED